MKSSILNTGSGRDVVASSPSSSSSAFPTALAVCSQKEPKRPRSIVLLISGKKGNDVAVVEVEGSDVVASSPLSFPGMIFDMLDEVPGTLPSDADSSTGVAMRTSSMESCTSSTIPAMFWSWTSADMVADS